MKAKIIQILLGTFGSLLTLFVAHMADASPEMTGTSAVGVGAFSAAALGDWFDTLGS